MVPVEHALASEVLGSLLLQAREGGAAKWVVVDDDAVQQSYDGVRDDHRVDLPKSASKRVRMKKSLA